MTFQRPTNIFWIEVDKIRPNELQPRTEFDQEKLMDLAESIKQYGVLQPLVVIRREKETDYGIAVEYELISGERRWRASKLAGLDQVPVIIRDDEGEKIKLELAIIENLQREDLNSLERALAFKKLIEDFNLKHHEVGARVGKSREYVSNTLRILNLPKEMQDALSRGQINEGHTRPLLMLTDRPDEQQKLFVTILGGKTNVRDAELHARGVAKERARKMELVINRDMQSVAEKLSDLLGTRVSVEKDGNRGKISIDFFSEEEFKALIEKVAGDKVREDVNVANDRIVVDDVIENQPEQTAAQEAVNDIIEEVEEIVASEQLAQVDQLEQLDQLDPASRQPESEQDLINKFTL